MTCVGDPELAETTFSKIQEKALQLGERDGRLLLAELTRKCFTEDDVKALKKNVNERFAAHKRQEALDKDWQESEKMASEASVQMWEEEKRKRRMTVSPTSPSQRRNAISEPSSKEIDGKIFPSLDHLTEKL